jgi:hypothetical protein
MKNVYIHLGMPKTGTTFLQTRCFPYLKGIRYANKEITELLDRIIYTNPIFLDLPKTKYEVDCILRKMAEGSLLISYERLFGNMLTNYHDNVYLANCLQMVFPEAKLIVVVRRQDELVESIYKQSLQSYYYQRINSFLNYRNHTFADASDPLSLPTIDIKQLNLRKYVHNYVELFGRNRILMLPYELLQQDQRAFLEKVFVFLGVQPFYPETNHQENRSYSWLSCHLALLLNRFVYIEGDGSRLFKFIPNKPFSSYLRKRPANTRLHKRLSAINSRLTLRHFLQDGVDKVFYIKGHMISSDKRRQIMSFHAESNRKLDEEFSLNLQSFGYY